MKLNEEMKIHLLSRIDILLKEVITRTYITHMYDNDDYLEELEDIAKSIIKLAMDANHGEINANDYLTINDLYKHFKIGQEESSSFYNQTNSVNWIFE